MLTEQGRVLAVEGDSLWVETLKQSACAKCSARHGCGQKLLATANIKSDMTVVRAYLNDSSASVEWSVGDQAVLGVNENALVLGALIAYGIPLVCMILGAALGNGLFLAEVELYSVLGALLGLIVGGILVRIVSRSQQQKPYFQAHVVGRAHTNELSLD